MIGALLCSERYEILEKVGEGGAAIVFRARDHSLGRDVAVKVLRNELAQDREFVQRFQREAHAAAGLSHPSIASVFDIGYEAGCHYFVMELLGGGTLKERLDNEGKLPADEAMRIAVQVASALRHAHESGIVHRDIKPQNILFTRDGDIKVTDFGIARALSASSVSQTGTIIGSVKYLAPEQANGDGAVPQSDMYSLGIVLYEMLSDQVPFDGDTPIAIAMQHVGEPAPSVREVEPSVPMAICELLDRMLAKRSHDRHATTADLLRELETVRQAVSVQMGENHIHEPPAPPDPMAGDTTRIIHRPEAMGPAYRQTRDTLRSPVPPRATRDRFSPATWVLVFLTALAGTVGVLFLWLTGGASGDSPEEQVAPPARTAPVPNVVGLPLSDARKMASDMGFTLDADYREYDGLDPDIVIEQHPAANAEVEVPATLRVVATKPADLSADLVPVPDVSGLHYTDALAELEALGLDPAESRRADEIVPRDYVIRTDCAPDDKLQVGDKIVVHISSGPWQAWDPEVLGPDTPLSPEPVTPDGPEDDPEGPEQPTEPGDGEGPEAGEGTDEGTPDASADGERPIQDLGLTGVDFEV